MALFITFLCKHFETYTKQKCILYAAEYSQIQGTVVLTTPFSLAFRFSFNDVDNEGATTFANKWEYLIIIR